MKCFMYRRGDICTLYDNAPAPGQSHVLRGERPCVIVSSEHNNRYSGTMIVAPITSTIKDRQYPGQFDIRLNGQLSRVRCDQIRVIDKHHLSEPYAALSRPMMDALDDALFEIMGLLGAQRGDETVEV